MQSPGFTNMLTVGFGVLCRQIASVCSYFAFHSNPLLKVLTSIRESWSNVGFNFPAFGLLINVSLIIFVLDQLFFHQQLKKETNKLDVLLSQTTTSYLCLSAVYCCYTQTSFHSTGLMRVCVQIQAQKLHCTQL